MELLRDVFVWAYERFTQEYLAIKQDLAEPDPLRLAYRDVIKQTVHAVVMSPGEDAMSLMTQAVAARVPEADRAAVLSIAVDELGRLHEGVLALWVAALGVCGVEGAGCRLMAAQFAELSRVVTPAETR